MGDPEKEMDDFLKEEIERDCVQGRIKDVKDKLTQIEEERRILIAEDGENADKWIRQVETEARAKYKAALILGEKALKKLGSASSVASSGPHSVSSKSSTRREPVSLPDFAGAEKAGNSPFLDFPVWLRN